MLDACSKSFTYNRNRNGPRIEVGGMPQLIFKLLDVFIEDYNLFSFCQTTLKPFKIIFLVFHSVIVFLVEFLDQQCQIFYIEE